MSSRRVLYLFFVALYFLAVIGPIGYARYRVPLEPTPMVLLVTGLAGSGLLDRIVGAVKRLRHPERCPGHARMLVNAASRISDADLVR